MPILLIALVLVLLHKPKVPQPYECLPWDKCPDCHGTGIIQLDGNDTIECPCTTEWR